MKYLFIDANHLYHRCAYTQQELTHENKPVGAMYGFLRSLVKVKREFPLHHLVIAWDGGHKRRDELSKEGVAKGIIPEVYKQNRLVPADEQTRLVRWQMDQQLPFLREALNMICAQVVQIFDYEADDVIASYVLERSDPSVIITSDKDYYQILGSDVVLVDPIKSTKMTLELFRQEYGLWPDQWADVGAFSGDAGDNIFGVKGIGEVTAVKLIKEHGNKDEVFRALRLRQQSGGKLKKVEEAALAYEARVHLAYLLKLVDEQVPGRPLLAQSALPSPSPLLDFFKRFGFDSLVDQVDALVT